MDREDPLKNESIEALATCSSTLAWKIPWTEEPGGAIVPGAAEESDTTS